MTGALLYWVADWNLTRAEAQQLLGGDVADMLDCTGAALRSGALGWVRSTTIRRFGGYDTGTPDIRWTVDDWRKLPGGSQELHIDQSDSDIPALSEVKEAEDVEGGAKTVGVAVEVAGQRLHRGLDAMIYCSRSVLGLVESAAHRAGLPNGRIVAYQWASDSSNPNTVIPGTHTTLKEAGADLSVVKVTPAPTPKPAVREGHATLTLTEFGGWSISGAPGQLIDTGNRTWAAKVTTRSGAWGVEPLPAE